MSQLESLFLRNHRKKGTFKKLLFFPHMEYSFEEFNQRHRQIVSNTTRIEKFLHWVVFILPTILSFILSYLRTITLSLFDARLFRIILHLNVKNEKSSSKVIVQPLTYFFFNLILATIGMLYFTLCIMQPILSIAKSYPDHDPISQLLFNYNIAKGLFSVLPISVYLLGFALTVKLIRQKLSFKYSLVHASYFLGNISLAIAITFSCLSFYAFSISDSSSFLLFLLFLSMLILILIMSIINYFQYLEVKFSDGTLFLLTASLILYQVVFFGIFMSVFRLLYSFLEDFIDVLKSHS